MIVPRLPYENLNSKLARLGLINLQVQVRVRPKIGLPVVRLSPSRHSHLHNCKVLLLNSSINPRSQHKGPVIAQAAQTHVMREGCNVIYIA